MAKIKNVAPSSWIGEGWYIEYESGYHRTYKNLPKNAQAWLDERPELVTEYNKAMAFAQKLIEQVDKDMEILEAGKAGKTMDEYMDYIRKSRKGTVVFLAERLGMSTIGRTTKKQAVEYLANLNKAA